CRHREYWPHSTHRMRVSFSSMIRVGDGPESIEVGAESVAELMQALLLRYPDLQEYLDRGVAVSINGQIFRDDWTVAIPNDAEVYLIPRIEGG
ncbi:MAG: MoaD/ThiS family protein, partial [Pseudomonadota bacterium]|nr:MoaD/ThiS family protein [Pseudomonadota bacterium]